MPEPHDRPIDHTLDLAPRSSTALDSGLATGLRRRSEPPRSCLGDLRPVLLKEAEGESALVVKPTSDAIPPQSEAGDRYQLSGEIARGGMGAVLRGRDVDLGRDLAVKVLLDRYADRPEVARRFIEEAQIGGQLQHPGVVPVYDIGRFGHRPFFTMKLVKGQTLAAILEDRADATANRPRLLGIALKVSETLAYAHAKGVIHRDLKPANIMVGAFGEVQVMDWGLAKVLVQGGIADEERASRAQQEPQNATMIRTARSTGSRGSFGTETEFGSLLGTPAYMPPEQANGDIANLDRRCDVFGLGAILCEILTGKPPYVGRSVEEVRRKAANGDLADAMARLDASGSEGELVALTKQCLSPEAMDRPKDAQEVTDGLSAYLNGAQERLQTAKRERAVADARALEERRRRKVQLALAGSLLAFTALSGLSATYFLQQRSERARLHTEQAAAVDRVVAQAETLRDQARESPEDVGRWQVALAAVTQAEAAQDELAALRLRALRAEIQAGHDAAQRDQTLLDRLVDIRSAEADDPDGSISDYDYAAAFRDGGIAVAKLPPAEAGAKIKARPPSLVLALAGALDDWAAIRRDKRKDAAGAASLSRAAQTADPDPWRTELRTALDEPDQATRLARLQALEKEAKYDDLGPISLHLLGAGLLNADDPALAESVLRKAQERHPRDVWINYVLAQALSKQHRHDDAIRFYTAARAIRPETAHQLGHALEKRGDRGEAVAIFRELRELRPSNARHLGCLGQALRANGQASDAEEAFDAAVVAGRDEVRLKPNSPFAYTGLGSALRGNRQFDEAIACFRKAIELDPKLATAHAHLGDALEADGQVDEAIACFRKVIELEPMSANSHTRLGSALRAKGQLDEAIAYHRKAIELDPRFAGAHYNLGMLQLEMGQWDEAIASFRKAIELDPQFASAHGSLGVALNAKGRLDEAIACYRKSIELDPNLSAGHANLGMALQKKGQVDEAIACFRKAIELDPKNAKALTNLGVALRSKGHVDEAIACLRKAIEVDPRLTAAHGNLSTVLLAKDQLDEAMACLRTALELDPTLAELHGAMGQVLLKQGRYAEAKDASDRALALLPERHPLRAVVSRQIRACEHFLKLDERFPRLLREEDQAESTQERLDFAIMCQAKRLYATATRFTAAAFADPQLASVLQAGHRYNGACCAALAAAGEGEDAAQHDNVERTQLRKQALDWLRADLALWTRQMETGSQTNRALVQQTLRNWQQAPALAGLRDPATLADLTDEEQQACTQLWADVAAVLKDAEAPVTREEKQ